MTKANQKIRNSRDGILDPWSVFKNRHISKKKKNKRRGNN
jgi:hypothetical protein